MCLDNGFLAFILAILTTPLLFLSQRTYMVFESLIFLGAAQTHG